MSNIAILIDAENVLPGYAEQIFGQAAALGDVACKEIFGAAQALTTWVEPVLKYAIHPNLTIKASKGKNSSDIALVIGAMELLLAHDIDKVILASSDSDFSALSVRLRNAGIDVIGMGTEKSNPLWRTSCSSFVVLQQPAKQSAAQPAKPAQKAQQKEKPAQQKEKAEPKSAEPKQEAASTHEERVGVIRQFIDRHLASHGGRMMVSQLISALNGLKEYRIDKKGSGKKPQNYLTGAYGADYAFEINADGASWIAAKDYVPTEAAPAEEAAAEVPAEGVEPVAAEPEAVAEAPVEAVEAPEAPDALAILLDAGIPEDVAQQIVVIFTESQSLREAYNQLRRTFGQVAGREYYQKVKELAAGQGANG